MHAMVMHHALVGHAAAHAAHGTKLVKLTRAQRKALPDSAFIFPKQRAYPIHDQAHGDLAMTMAKTHGTPAVQKEVNRVVLKEYPALRA